MTLEEDKIEEIKNATIQNVSRQEEDLFAGGYETYEEKEYYGNPNYSDSKILPTENFNSVIKPNRELNKI